MQALRLANETGEDHYEQQQTFSTQPRVTRGGYRCLQRPPARPGVLWISRRHDDGSVRCRSSWCERLADQHRNRRTASGAGGDYQFLNLVPGTYRVDVEQSGFKKATRDKVEVTVSGTVRVDISMQIGDVTQSVEV